MHYIKVKNTLVNLANVDFIDLDTNDLIIEFSKGGYKLFNSTQGVDVRAEFERIEKEVLAEAESDKLYYETMKKLYYEAMKLNIKMTRTSIEEYEKYQ